MISLVLPTYNAESSIRQSFESVRAFLNARPDPWEVLFTLDGCSDATEAVLQPLVAVDSRFRLLSYAANRGKGYAVRVGLTAALGDVRVFTDVDLAYRFDDIARVADEVRSGAEVAIASREHADSTIQLPSRLLGYAYRRRVQSHVFGRLARLILPLSQLDTQAGLKALSAAAVKRIVPNLSCDGFGFDCELLTACARYGIAVHEVAVGVRYEDEASTTGMTSTMKMLQEIRAIRRRWPKIGYPDVAAESSETGTRKRAA